MNTAQDIASHYHVPVRDVLGEIRDSPDRQFIRDGGASAPLPADTIKWLCWHYDKKEAQYQRALGRPRYQLRPST